MIKLGVSWLIVASRQQMSIAILALLMGVILTVWAAQSWGPAGERIITVFFISLIAVAGIGVYSGNSGILSFGHLAFMAVGAYASALLSLPSKLKSATLPNLPDWLAQVELSLPAALLVAVLFTLVLALVTGLIIGRLDGSAATISTLGLLVIIHGVIIGWRDVTRGAQSFFGVPRETNIIAAAIGCALALVIARVYRDSVSGLRLRASRENAIAADAVGIRIRRERLIAWVISAGIVALAGGLLAHFLGAFSVKKFYFTDTFFLLAMLIVGGMATVTGAVLGTIVITLVSEVLRRLESGFQLFGVEVPTVFGSTQIGIGLIILFVMFRKSDGLTGFKEWEERVFAGITARKSEKQSTTTNLALVNTVNRLRATSMTKRFTGVVAVNDVSLSLKPGEILGVIGPNGSGKTTLLNLLSGILQPDAGTVHLGDVVLTDKPGYYYARQGIARTFQNIRLFGNLSVYQNVHVAALNSDSKQNKASATARCDEALQLLGLTDKSSLNANTLPYGDQRRVEIARALALGPSLLFLDEPAAGMNNAETKDLMIVLQKLVSSYGIGILLVDHDLKLINSVCNRIIVLNDGQLIAEGTPEEIRHNPAVIEAYIGRRRAALQT